MKKNDHPIVLNQDDLLRRGPFAQIVAEEIQSLDVSHGTVVAITGPWGSGKTSFVNLIKNNLGVKITPVDFNPWFFSGSNDLLWRFFSEFADALDHQESKQKRLADSLKRYSQVLRPFRGIPVAGIYVEFATSAMEIAGNTLDRDEPSLVETKKKLEEALMGQDRIFLVFIDDIDRLESEEIRTIMKLVRLVGNLPRVVYLLAYDHSRVVSAISRDTKQGEEYLEKIVFNAYQIPKINESFIRDVLFEGLDEILQEFNIELADDPERISGVIREVLLPSMSTLRNVKRFLTSCRPVLKELREDVDVLDLLCLECIRLFNMDAFVQLAESSHNLAWTINDHQLFDTSRSEASKAVVKEMLHHHPSSWIEWILKNLFPFAWRHYDDRFSLASDPNKFLRDRRVGNRDVLTKYLERFDERGIVARRRTTELLGLVPAQEIVDAFFDSIPLDNAADVAELLADMAAGVPQPLIIPISRSLLNLSAQELVQRRRFFDTGIEEPARIFVARQLERMDTEVRNDMANHIYRGLSSFESKYRLLKVLEMSDDDDEVLLEAEESRSFLNTFADEFEAANPDKLASERWLLFLSKEVLKLENRKASSLPDFLGIADSAWAFLRSSVSESINYRGDENPLTLDLVGVERVLGSRERALELVALCEQNPTGNPSDEKVLNAAKRTLSLAERPDQA